MSKVVLDSSAVLALLLGEAGGDEVVAVQRTALVSTVNSSEVLLKLIDKGMTADEAQTEFDRLVLGVREFTQVDALQGAVLRKPTQHAGLSFADRACLALALREGLPVLTGDRDWSRVNVGVEVRLIR